MENNRKITLSNFYNGLEIERRSFKKIEQCHQCLIN